MTIEKLKTNYKAQK